MEEKLDLMPFDEWIKTLHADTEEEEYYFSYDDGGMVTGLHPKLGAIHFDKKIKVDLDIAHDIFEGKEHLKTFRVNTLTKELIKMSSFLTSSLTKIDDILHRIVDRKWALDKEPDVIVRYVIDDAKLIFSLSPKHKGVIWDGDVEMNFLVTGYNDPNDLKSMIRFNVGDLVDSDKEIPMELYGRFSVYTRRMFENYVFEAV